MEGTRVRGALSGQFRQTLIQIRAMNVERDAIKLRLRIMRSHFEFQWSELAEEQREKESLPGGILSEHAEEVTQVVGMLRDLETQLTNAEAQRELLKSRLEEREREMNGETNISDTERDEGSLGGNGDNRSS